MPEVGKAEHHCIDILAGAYSLVVAVGIDSITSKSLLAICLLDVGLGKINTAGVKITDRNNAGKIRTIEHTRNFERRSDSSKTDDSHANLLVC